MDLRSSKTLTTGKFANDTVAIEEARLDGEALSSKLTVRLNSRTDTCL